MTTRLVVITGCGPGGTCLRSEASGGDCGGGRWLGRLPSSVDQPDIAVKLRGGKRQVLAVRRDARHDMPLVGVLPKYCGPPVEIHMD